MRKDGKKLGELLKNLGKFGEFQRNSWNYGKKLGEFLKTWGNSENFREIHGITGKNLGNS